MSILTENNICIDNPDLLGLSKNKLQKINSEMTQYIESGLMAGCISCISRNGHLAHMAMHGYAELSHSKPITIDTLFRLYELATPIIHVAFLLLYEEGHLVLDEPIDQYLPEFSRMQVKTNNGLVSANCSITPRQLLTFRSGINGRAFSLVNDKGLHDDPDGRVKADERLGASLEGYVRKLAGQPLIVQPGTTWRFSDSSAVIARLVEIISGSSLTEFLKEKLFIPLGMKDTAYVTDKSPSDRLMMFYTQQSPNGDLSEMGGHSDDCYINPSLGGGLISTVTDYLLFAQMVLNNGEHNHSQFMSAFSARLAHYYPKGFTNVYDCRSPVIQPGQPQCSPANQYILESQGSSCFWIDGKEKIVGVFLTQLFPHKDQTISIPRRFYEMTYSSLVHSYK